MATTLTAPDDISTEPEPPLADPALLQDRTPEWFKTTPRSFGFVVVIGLAFVLLSHIPLWHTDLWGHLSYGRLIWNAKALPATEPLMPLAQGVPMVDSAWLSQLLGYGAHSLGGTAALQGLYASAISLCLGLLLWRCHRRTGHVLISGASAAVFLWVNWQQLHVVRPQLAGMVFFVTLLTILTAPRWRKANWFAVPALFTLWANMHGSFVVGLVLLGCFALGEAVDVWRKTGSLRMACRGRRAWRYLLLAQLAAVAALVNPYGLGLYVEVLTFSGNPNLSDLREWDPLTMASTQGRAAAMVALALVFVYRMSPRRVRAVEVLTLVGFGFAALMTSRLILWWTPLAAWHLAVHAAAIRRRAVAPPDPDDLPLRKGLWTVASAGLVWVFFALSPIGNHVLEGSPADPHKVLSEQTPVDLVVELEKLKPTGQIFNTYEWGDYLLWNQPPDSDSQVFVASHAHLVPREVWRHYMDVISQKAGWQETLSRYGVNTVVVDHRYREAMIRSLKNSDDWKLEYDDVVGAIFTRIKRI